MGEALAIVRRPGEDLSDCELTHLARQPIDSELLGVQHRAYVEALRSAGAEVLVLDPLDGCPDAVYVEDTAVVLDELAVLARPGAASRRGEVASLATVLAPMRTCVTIAEPGTLDGGDICLHEGILYVGQGGRTNHAGLKQLAHLVLEHGYQVKAVEVDGCLHLKSAMSSLADGRLLVNPAWVHLGRVVCDDLLEVHPDEPFGANVLAVGERLICSAAYPRTNARLARAGFDLLELDLSELHKMEAAVTCPSILLSVA